MSGRVDYQEGSNLLRRVLDRAVRDEGLTFGEALDLHIDAVPGVLRAAVELRRAVQAEPCCSNC